jgi:hypothetical protein
LSFISSWSSVFSDLESYLSDLEDERERRAAQNRGYNQPGGHNQPGGDVHIHYHVDQNAAPGTNTNVAPGTTPAQQPPAAGKIFIILS